MDKMQGTLVELNRQAVNMVFQNARTQGDYVIGLYRLVYPGWDNIVKVNGFPTVSDTDGAHLFQQAIAFDRREHPDVMAGGAWLNNGFSVSDGVEDGFCQQADYTTEEG